MFKRNQGLVEIVLNNATSLLVSYVGVNEVAKYLFYHKDATSIRQ